VLTPRKGAVILAKHAAQDHQDAVLGPAAVLDAASQARHAVAVSGYRISLDQSTNLPPSWCLGKTCCETGTTCCGSLCCLAGSTCCGGWLLAFL
jgi:hypothetical protein